MADKLTTTEAATRLGCSRSWLRNLIHQGRLPAEKIGRDWLITSEDLPTPSKHGRKMLGPRQD